MSGPPLLIHGNVGPATGAVRHPGDVEIHGNLLTDGWVRADGDLHIRGNVISAKASAARNMIVDGIVSGTATVLDAIRSITVRQADDALLIAGQDIIVLTAAERCHLQAGAEILLTGVPGLLRGGVARAGNGVTACRIESAAGQPAKIEIGGRVFPETLPELEERLAFTRKQTMRVKLRSGDSPQAYRRGLARLRAYRRLARKLDHRVSRMRMVGYRYEPVLTVTGDDPISAVLLLGPDGRVVEVPPNGPFELGIENRASESSSTLEVACEQ